MEARNFVAQAVTLFNNRNGKALAIQLALPLNLSAPQYRVLTGSTTATMNQLCNSAINDITFRGLILNRLLAVLSLSTSDYNSGFRQILSAYNATVDLFTSSDSDSTSWLIPVISQISNDLRLIAGAADRATGDAENTLLREAVQSLTKGWTAVARDRLPVTDPASKKLALFAVTNVLFKIYFSLNTLSLCMKLINVVEGPGSGGIMAKLRQFPVSDVVTYKYYNGRLKMFEDKYEEARECLRFALRFCPKSCTKNRQRILASLVPVEMNLGVFPTRLVAELYGLRELAELGNAARLGDLRSYNAILQQNQRSFVRVGVYLVLEQVVLTVQRNLVKRVAALAESTRVNLMNVETAFKWLGEETDLDEIECILANLIFQGKIKGYLSHQKRFLVLSAKDPFPKDKVVKRFAGEFGL